MKTTHASVLRAAALAAALAVLPLIASAANSAPVDRAAQQLALRGSVPVTNAGPYVEIGTYAIQVSVKLGQPSAKLLDGTWLYDHCTIANSAAEGTLIVRFVEGRVSALELAGPSVIVALRAPARTSRKMLVAKH